MEYLIDTHTFIWYCEGSEKLSNTARNLIDSSTNKITISIASLWEISIKAATNKIIINNSFESIFDDIINFDFHLLAIEFPHLVVQKYLPFHHRDPFDRILIAQSISEKIDIISADTIIDDYFVGTNLKRIW